MFLTDKANRHRGGDQFPRDRGGHAGRGRLAERDEPGPAMGSRESVDMAEVALDLTPA
jgi:hypothetical protein